MNRKLKGLNSKTKISMQVENSKPVKTVKKNIKTFKKVKKKRM